MKSRVLVAMSVGVDSSVAAALLVEEGHEVVGATMKTFCYSETEGPSKTCCGLDGIMDAQRVARALGVPHYVFDVESEFTRDVIDDFVDEYANGRTPNPCVRCNSNTKFKDLLARGRSLGCDAIASGHYVRIEHGNGESALFRGTDHNKDQSYFLWGLPRDMLPLLRFPLGRLTKQEVRGQAHDLGLVTADKPESQEICFVPTGNYRDLLEKRLEHTHPALQPGSVVDLEGQVVGQHSGYAGYTIGQRKRLGGGFPEQMFVIAIRTESRQVVVGPRDACFSDSVDVSELNWHHKPLEQRQEVLVQIRYRAKPVRATVVESGDPVRLMFAEPQRAVTPGQSAAIYEGERLVGGGRILLST